MQPMATSFTSLVESGFTAGAGFADEAVIDESYANHGWRAADNVQRVNVPLDGSSLTQQ
ncbi:hypothetical protein F442_02316 [Phytophthora nicotianae P10297]|uniref:Uncharacterized protein n=1 Tax=Phytophthora nicotianae P10297 TaxID=1317064 RepID=W2ZZL4_PHYNI|nr:hypothetical protein F442_02316 [Phytophthora nicotianae P10297]